MDLWFTEEHSENARFSIKVNKHIFTKDSKFQRIDILESNEFGRFLTLDGLMMLTEKDEFIYHEMITHTAMAVNPKIENILVIGGGDGGAVRELCKYDSIKNIDLVEIDEEVVLSCIKYLPSVSGKLKDEKVNIYYQDGLKFVRNKENIYDLIIVDSTDPFGPGEGLFTREFYGNCFRALKEEGILINQHESDFYHDYESSMKRAHKRIHKIFPICKVYEAHIPTYPSGHWYFGFASKKFDPVRDIKEQQWNDLNIKTKYYNTDLHKGSFSLPNYVKEMMVIENE